MQPLGGILVNPALYCMKGKSGDWFKRQPLRAAAFLGNQWGLLLEEDALVRRY